MGIGKSLHPMRAKCVNKSYRMVVFALLDALLGGYTWLCMYHVYDVYSYILRGPFKIKTNPPKPPAFLQITMF